MTSERYKVHVSKDYLVFCSGHFISFEGSKCERLHGHNYRACGRGRGASRRELLRLRLHCLEERNQEDRG